MSGEYIWVIDDDQSIRWVLEKALKQADMEVSTFETADDALQMVRDNAIPPNAIISDIRMPGSDGLSLLKQIKSIHPELPVLIMTAFSDLDSTVSAFEEGAFEYIPKPFDVDQVIERTQRACEVLAEKQKTPPRSAKADTDEEQHDELIGDAPAMQEVFKAIGRLSKSKITVMINGESGTGKELIAQALHRHSPRSSKPFVALNMAAIPHDLMESELFGHEKGAFTGAQSMRVGRFEQSDGGTLFLDEIGDMPATLQTRLLRVLADGQFYRVGGHTPIKVDVRIIAATHQNLETLVDQKLFREDLFHRLNVIRIEAPPLRERREDIPMLLNHFLEKAATELNETTKKMTPEFKAYVTALPWPGNVRQLQNTAHWLTVMASGNDLKVEDLPKHNQELPIEVDSDWEASFRQWANKQLHDGETNLLSKATPAFERILIQVALNKTQDKRQEAARLLGWGRNTLTRKIRELELD
jgi:two-component system nitrogen regulation response regulator GlnG